MASSGGGGAGDADEIRELERRLRELRAGAGGTNKRQREATPIVVEAGEFSPHTPQQAGAQLTQDDVIHLIRGFFNTNIAPQIVSLITQIDQRVTQTEKEIEGLKTRVGWLENDSRQLQVESAKLMVNIGKWPASTDFTIADREAVVRYLVDKATLEKSDVAAITTILYPAGHLSKTTMVRFHSFEARTKFLQYTARNSTKAWKNETTYKDFLKISPQMPRWQRRMESPIHTLMNCINKFEPLKSTTLKPYWKSLMIFAGPEGSKDSPQTIAPGDFLGTVDYVKYEEHPMGFRCDMYINEKLHSTV
jgi:regulator of replication initiation timing